MRIVKYISYFLTKRRVIIKSLVKYQNFLSNGRYKISPNIAYIESNKLIFSIEMNLLLKFLFSKKIELFSEEKTFSAHTMLINAQGNAKFFSDSEVLTLSNKKDIERMIQIYSEVKEFFPYPKVLKVEDNFYIEEFIDGVKPTVKEVFEILINFYKTQDAQYKKNKTATFQGEESSFYIYSHNDIHLKNIIKKEGLYFIDWEYYGQNIFYYDFINLLFVPTLEGDYQLMKNYFLGIYDDLFQELFEVFNLTFEDKNLYLYTYLNCRIEMLDKNEERVNKYREIIQCVEL